MDISKDNNPEDVLKQHFAAMSSQSSIAPIAYSAVGGVASPNIDLTASSTQSGGSKHKKVSIIGCGQVGMAIAFAIINQEIAGSIALVDINEDKLDGEVKDLRQGSAFHQRVRIEASSDYEITAGSHLIIVTAGAAQKPGMSRLSLVEINVRIMKFIIPELLKYNPETPICMVSNPCDIITAVAAKIAGPSVPPGRIFGSGTCLDTSRLRSLIGNALNVDTRNVHGYIIGEHGDSSIAVWSGVNVGGVPLLEHGAEPSEVHHAMHRNVVESAGDVIIKKGYTNWAVGLTVAHIAKNVLDDTGSIITVSTCVRGLYGIENDVYSSIPCVIGGYGVRRVVILPLSESEKTGLIKSCKLVWEVQKGVWDSV